MHSDLLPLRQFFQFFHHCILCHAAFQCFICTQKNLSGRIKQGNISHLHYPFQELQSVSSDHLYIMRGDIFHCPRPAYIVFLQMLQLLLILLSRPFEIGLHTYQ